MLVDNQPVLHEINSKREESNINFRGEDTLALKRAIILEELDDLAGEIVDEAEAQDKTKVDKNAALDEVREELEGMSKFELTILVQILMQAMESAGYPEEAARFKAVDENLSNPEVKKDEAILDLAKILIDLDEKFGDEVLSLITG